MLEPDRSSQPRQRPSTERGAEERVRELLARGVIDPEDVQRDPESYLDPYEAQRFEAKHPD